MTITYLHMHAALSLETNNLVIRKLRNFVGIYTFFVTFFRIKVLQQMDSDSMQHTCLFIFKLVHAGYVFFVLCFTLWPNLNFISMEHSVM